MTTPTPTPEPTPTDPGVTPKQPFVQFADSIRATLAGQPPTPKPPFIGSLPYHVLMLIAQGTSMAGYIYLLITRRGF